MKYDLLLKGGKVFDPGSNQCDYLDVSIKNGKIATVARNIQSNEACNTIEVTGKYVFPGFIDFHTHTYWGGTPLGINVDQLAPVSGVTTWIDAGSSGPGNFEGFLHHVITPSIVDIMPFLNLSFVGLVTVGQTELRFGELFDYRLADKNACLRIISKFKNIIGIKLRLGHTSSGPNGLYYLSLARFLGDISRLPLMVHVDQPPLLKEVLSYLKEGDIITHCFAKGLIGNINNSEYIRGCVTESKKRGVYFDLGHGAGSFSFLVAKKALSQGFLPDFISTDLHAYNVGGPVFDLPTTISKFLALGVPLKELIARVTVAPARFLNLENKKGCIIQSADADIAIGHIEEGKFAYSDSFGNIQQHDKRLVIDFTIFKGNILRKPNKIENGKRKPGLIPLDSNLTLPNWWSS